MCLAVYKPAGIAPNWDHLETGMYANSDGAGFAVAVDGQLIVEKGFFKFADFKRALEPFGDAAAIIHFRLATHGSKNAANCHPFHLPDFGEPEASTLSTAVIHNGIFSDAASDQKQWSDTWHTCRDILHPLWSARGHAVFGRPEIKKLGDKFVGGTNKLVFLSSDGTYAIWGESNGHWEGGVWYSNHSYESWGIRCADPRQRYVSGRDYDYEDWDDYFKSRSRQPSVVVEEEDDELIEFDETDYSTFATAIEQALVEELRECGYTEEDIQHHYLRGSLAVEVAAVYEIEQSEAVKHARTRAENESLSDAVLPDGADPKMLVMVPSTHTYVGMGELANAGSGKPTGDILGWSDTDEEWQPMNGVLCSTHYAVRSSRIQNHVTSEHERAIRSLPDGYTIVGAGPLRCEKKPVDGDILLWDALLMEWTHATTLPDLPTLHYAAREGFACTRDATRENAVRMRVGHRYVTRSGEITGPVELNPNKDTRKRFPFCARIDANLHTFTETGSFTLVSSSPKDLVREHTLALEEGKRYIRRDGAVAGPVYANPSPADGAFFPFAVDNGSGRTTYKADGTFISGKQSPLDLMEEFTGVPVEAGKCYTTRSGSVTGPAELMNARGAIKWFRVELNGRTVYVRGDGRRFSNKEDESDLVALAEETAVISHPVANGYRKLEVGELIKEGDEFVTESGKWMPTQLIEGNSVVGTVTTYRRKIGQEVTA